MTASTASSRGLRRKDRLFAADTARQSSEPPVLFRLPLFGAPSSDAPAAITEPSPLPADAVPPETDLPEPEPLAAPAATALDQHFGRVAAAPPPDIEPQRTADFQVDTRQPQPVRENWAPLAPLGQASKSSSGPLKPAIDRHRGKPWREVAGSRLVLLLLLAVVAVAALVAGRGPDISNPIRLAGQQAPDQRSSDPRPSASFPPAAGGASSAAANAAASVGTANRLATSDQRAAEREAAHDAPQPSASFHTTHRAGDAAYAAASSSDSTPPAESASSPAEVDAWADPSPSRHDGIAVAGASPEDRPDDAALMLSAPHSDKGGADAAVSQQGEADDAATINPYAEQTAGDWTDALSNALEAAAGDAIAGESSTDHSIAAAAGTAGSESGANAGGQPGANAGTVNPASSAGPAPIQMTETPRGVYDWNRYLPPPAGAAVAAAQDMAGQPIADPYVAAVPGNASGAFGDPRMNAPAPQAPSGDASYGGYGGALPPTGYPASGSPPSGYPPNGYPASGYPANGYPANGYPANDYPANDYPANGYPANGYPVEGYPPAGYPPSPAMQPSAAPQQAPLQATSPYDPPRR